MVFGCLWFGYFFCDTSCIASFNSAAFWYALFSSGLLNCCCLLALLDCVVEG